MEQVFCKKCDSEKNLKEVKKNLNLCPDCNSDLSAGLKSSTTPKAKTIEVSTHKGESEQFQPVTIEDIKMPFGSMVMFMVKWVIASIPAMIILFIIGLILSALGIGTLAIFK